LATGCYHRRQVGLLYSTFFATPAAALFACFKVGARLGLELRLKIHLSVAKAKY
jgi:hypothetical protein